LERDGGHWQARLPAGLLHLVAWPVRVEAFHDDAVPSSKWRGHDALGLLCYYRHVFSRWSIDLDDAESGPGLAVDDPNACELLQQEDLEAWRTLLGTWVRRVQRVRRVDTPVGHTLVVDSGFEIVSARAIPRL
jgi:hypothetical protein